MPFPNSPHNRFRSTETQAEQNLFMFMAKPTPFQQTGFAEKWTAFEADCPYASATDATASALTEQVAVSDTLMLRAASDDDAPAIRALFALTQKEFGFDYDFNERESDLMEIELHYGGKDAYMGVLWDIENDTLAGTVALRRPDYDHTTLEPDPDCVELCRVYAYPEYRGKGLGRKLVTMMIEKARQMGYGRMVLESHSSLVDALRLYKRLGFCEIPPYTPDDPDYSDYAAELRL
ncbi:MAG: GNAT family N-acetyltransferase [Vampirovibrionales bacterium]|nr:GNAT family N-acetyltransferase [Vampirovibrionales bacterium]